MIDVLVEYHKYVPFLPDGTPQPIILYGDGLSCERGHDAQMSRANHDTPADRLEGLWMAIQEWHHKAICLKVF